MNIRYGEHSNHGDLSAEESRHGIRSRRLGHGSFASMLFTLVVVFASSAFWAGDARANPTWSGCTGCHGAFLATPYNSPTGGPPWAAGLHNTHRFLMISDCATCHTGDPDLGNVFLGASDGGTGFPPVSCVGCHGRQEYAGNDSLSPGLGAGLRQHHFNSFITSCAGCHADANPANYTPVGENVPPPYYFTPDTAPGHGTKPTDPCSPAGEEDCTACRTHRLRPSATSPLIAFPCARSIRRIARPSRTLNVTAGVTAVSGPEPGDREGTQDCLPS